MEQAQAELTTLVGRRIFVHLQIVSVTLGISGILGTSDAGELGTTFMVSTAGIIGGTIVQFNCDNIEAIELCSTDVIAKMGYAARVWINPFPISLITKPQDNEN